MKQKNHEKQSIYQISVIPVPLGHEELREIRTNSKIS